MIAPDPHGKLVAALQGALQAMMLTHGFRIGISDSSGYLNFEREMLSLREALMMLSVDPDKSLDC